MNPIAPLCAWLRTVRLDAVVHAPAAVAAPADHRHAPVAQEQRLRPAALLAHVLRMCASLMSARLPPMSCPPPYTPRGASGCRSGEAGRTASARGGAPSAVPSPPSSTSTSCRAGEEQRDSAWRVNAITDHPCAQTGADTNIWRYLAPTARLGERARALCVWWCVCFWGGACANGGERYWACPNHGD